MASHTIAQAGSSRTSLTPINTVGTCLAPAEALKLCPGEWCRSSAFPAWVTGCWWAGAWCLSGDGQLELLSSRTGAWSVPGRPGAESQAGVPTLPGAGGVSSTRPDRGRAIWGLGRPDRGRTPRGHPRTTSCWPICPPARCAGQARISPTQTGRRGRGERVGMSDFRSRAACRDVEPELFFPVGTGVTALR